MDYILEMKNISKCFGEVEALRQVDFSVPYNEVVGLVGDNGAGKSTLIKIVTGYHLADLQSLWRNIFMGRELANRFGLLDVKGMEEETRKLMVGSMGFTSSAVTPESTIQTFSGGEKQGVAIVRALYFQAELIILDEPTMGLSLSETRKLLDFVRAIKEAGNVFHVHSVADRIVVLDRGRKAGEFLTKDITLDELMEKMYRVAQTGILD
jgi:simple sugar transport system ATP-binding protein